ncbi:MAG: helix-turn-helix transcriptional regulator [Bacteroidota bacterium]
MNRCTRGEDYRNCRRDIPALPFCHIHLSAKIPQKVQYTEPPKTIGDHIKKRRLQLGWGAMQLAALLKVSKDTVYNWEKNRGEPMVHLIPRITQFLGYTPPLFAEQTAGQKIVAYRHVRGMSQRALAIELKVDPGTLGRWERDESLPTGKLKTRLEPFFKEIISGDGRTDG